MVINTAWGWGTNLELENPQHNVPLRLKQNSVSFCGFLKNPSVIVNLLCQTQV